MKSGVDWNDLKFLVALAKGKTLSGAATELHVSPSTISRRIEALESALQLTLFRPQRDGYDLTEVGQALLPAADQAAKQFRSFERTARDTGNDVAGAVRIEAPELLGQEILLTALIGFRMQYPNIQIELRSSVQPVKLAAEEADIVLRLIRPSRGNYRLRKVGAVGFGLYASAEYVEEHGTPEDPKDLYGQYVIGWADDFQSLTMATWLSNHFPDLRPALRLTTFSAQVEAVRQGAGWAVLPDFVAVPRGYVAALQTLPHLQTDLWLLVHEHAQTLPKVKLVRDLIASTLLGKFRQ